MLAALASAGCATRPPATPPAPSSFIDLQPGWRLRVVTPILKSGGYQMQPAIRSATGNDFTVTAGQDFLGYEKAFYRVRAERIVFVSAVETRDGRTLRRQKSRVPLFDLPPGLRHFRLIYMQRVSAADHEMALAAAAAMPDLEALTARVLRDPTAACRSEAGVYCRWVPAGISVAVQ